MSSPITQAEQGGRRQRVHPVLLGAGSFLRTRMWEREKDNVTIVAGADLVKGIYLQ